MSDAARIERLTGLARRVVLSQEPDVDPETVTVEVWGEGGGCCAVACGGRFTVDYHPRALDALEAALMVLAGEPGDPVAELALKLANKRAETLRESQAKLASLADVADAWDAEATRRSTLSDESHERREDLHSAYCAGQSAGHAKCAAELRAILASA